MSKLSGLNQRFAGVQGNQGYGGLGPWPNEGESCEVECTVDMIFKENAKFNYGQGKARKEAEAFSIQFLYEWQDGPEPMAFKGREWIVPYDIDALPQSEDKAKGGKQQQRAEISLGVVKGSLAALTGAEDPNSLDDLEVAIKEVQQAMESHKSNNSVCLARVFLRQESQKQPNGSTRINKEDYIRELLTGSS